LGEARYGKFSTGAIESRIWR